MKFHLWWCFEFVSCLYFNNTIEWRIHVNVLRFIGVYHTLSRSLYLYIDGYEMCNRISDQFFQAYTSLLCTNSPWHCLFKQIIFSCPLQKKKQKKKKKSAQAVGCQFSSIVFHPFARNIQHMCVRVHVLFESRYRVYVM